MTHSPDAISPPPMGREETLEYLNRMRDLQEKIDALRHEVRAAEMLTALAAISRGESQ